MRAVVGGAVVALLILGWLVLVGPLPGERSFDHWIRTIHWGKHAINGMVLLLNLGDPLVSVVTAVTISAAITETFGPRAGIEVLVSTGAVLVTALTKTVIHATHAIAQGPGQGFPSGHGAYVTAVWGTVAIYAYRSGRPVAAAAICLPIALMPVALLVMSAHSLSEVAGGYAIGVAWLGFVRTYFHGARTAR